MACSYRPLNDAALRHCCLLIEALRSMLWPLLLANLPAQEPKSSVVSLKGYSVTVTFVGWWPTYGGIG
jgi:hypothetical protein